MILYIRRDIHCSAIQQKIVIMILLSTFSRWPVSLSAPVKHAAWNLPLPHIVQELHSVGGKFSLTRSLQNSHTRRFAVRNLKILQENIVIFSKYIETHLRGD